MKPLENLPPFYVGQKVVANTNHDSGLIKDRTYTVLSIKKFCCGFVLDVGLKIRKEHCETVAYCAICNKTGNLYHGKAWGLSHIRFTPLQESVFPTLTLSRVIEKELQLTSMN